MELEIIHKSCVQLRICALVISSSKLSMKLIASSTESHFGNIYRLPTKLREGNVFISMSLFGGGAVCMPGPMSLLGEGWVCLVLGSLRGGGMPSPRSPLGCGVCIQEGVGIPGGGCTSGGEGKYTRGGVYAYPQTWDLGSPSHQHTGGHHNTYGWKAGGTYPIGMLSC